MMNKDNCSFKWMDRKIRCMRWYHISMIKISSAAFALLVAKLWSPLLSLEWYWYAVICVVAAMIPMRMMFCKRSKCDECAQCNCADCKECAQCDRCKK